MRLIILSFAALFYSVSSSLIDLYAARKSAHEGRLIPLFKRFQHQFSWDGSKSKIIIMKNDLKHSAIYFRNWSENPAPVFVEITANANLKSINWQLTLVCVL